MESIINDLISTISSIEYGDITKNNLVEKLETIKTELEQLKEESEKQSK